MVSRGIIAPGTLYRGARAEVITAALTFPAMQLDSTRTAATAFISLALSAVALAQNPTERDLDANPAAEALPEPVDGSPLDGARVLVFTKTAGFVHASIPAGKRAVMELGAAHGFAVDTSSDASRFSDEGLAPYAAVVFLSTTGDVLDAAQEAAFERYIARGKGYVGVHAAADTEYDWPFYRELVGRQFVQHPEHQTATVYPVPAGVEDFPGGERVMAGFGDSLTLFEEWYEYTVPYAVGLRDLMRVDTATYSTRGYKGTEAMGVYHPLAWYHEHGGGRAFYTGIGHMDETFALPAFREHLLAGIGWAVGG